MIRAQGTPAGGRWRLGAIVGRVLGLALLVGVAGHFAPAWAQDELFVTNQDSNSVTVYFRTADGDVTPVRTLSEGLTGLSDPSGLFLDTVNNELFVANAGNDTVTVYPLNWTDPNTPPIRKLDGLLTGLKTPTGVFVDTVHGELFVANFIAGSVTVYSRTASGDTGPTRTLIGGSTGLAGPFGLAVDTVHNELFVANFSTPSVTVYSRTASGDTGSTRTISGGDTGLGSPQFVAVTVSAPIPTLSEWAQIGMAALLVLGGRLALRSFGKPQDRLRSGLGKCLHTS